MFLLRLVSILAIALILLATISGVIAIASEKSVLITKVPKPTPLSLAISNRTYIPNASRILGTSSHSSPSTYFYDPREVVKTEEYWSFQDYPLYVPIQVKPLIVNVFTNAECGNWSGPIVVTKNLPTGYFRKIILRLDVKLESSVPGRPAVQYDRPLWIFVDGAPLFVGTTTQRYNYTVSVDVTHLYPLLMGSREFSLVLLNWVRPDWGLTGVFYVNATLYYFPGRPINKPDLIIPLWSSGPGNWREGLGIARLTASAPNATQTITIPRNTLKVKLLLYLEGASYDEFWWDYIPPFRWVEILSDDKPIAITQPFPYIYTGGINPLLWRPQPAVKTLGFEPMIIDLTPHLPRLVGTHNITVVIKNMNNYWWVFGALLIYRSETPGPTYIPLSYDYNCYEEGAVDTIDNATVYDGYGYCYMYATTRIKDGTKGYIASSYTYLELTTHHTYNDVWDNVTMSQLWINQHTFMTQYSLIGRVHRYVDEYVREIWAAPFRINYAFFVEAAGDPSQATSENPVPANFSMYTTMGQGLVIYKSGLIKTIPFYIKDSEIVMASGILNGTMMFISPTAAIITSLTYNEALNTKITTGREVMYSKLLIEFWRSRTVHTIWPTWEVLADTLIIKT